MSGFNSVFQRISDGIVREIQVRDPEFVENMQEDHKKSVKQKLLGLAALVAGVALLCLGIGLCMAGPIGMGFGIPLIFISLPILWASYNYYRVFSNLEEITKDPAKYIVLNRYKTGSDEIKIIERNKLISMLEKNTLLLSPILENLV